MKKQILDILLHTPNSITWGELAERLYKLFETEKKKNLNGLLDKMQEARSKNFGFKLDEDEINQIFEKELKRGL